MKSTITLAIIAATAGLANAKITVIYDVSGTQFFDEQGSPNNTILDISLGTGIEIASITHIAWDVNLTTFTDPNAVFPSWAQEAIMTFNGAENVEVAAGVNHGVMNQNFTGNQASSLVLADGILSIEFWESFDDSVGNADAQLGAGSTITIRGNIFPTPGSLAVLGLGGLIAGRRRRSSS